MKKIIFILYILFCVGCATTTQTTDKCETETNKKECCSKK